MAPEPIAEQAALALRMATEDPQQAEALAEEARCRAIEAGLPGAESTALRALGLAARLRHQIPAALAHLRAAVDAAQRAFDANLAAEAQLSMALALVLAGDNEEAMNTLDAARASGPTAVLVAFQRALVLSMLGRYEEALKAYRPVVPAFRRLEDRAREARALNSRGLVHVYMGHFALAEADLLRAERLMVGLGNRTEAAGMVHNRGFAAARKGDLPVALTLFEEADRLCRKAGVHSGARGLDRAGALQAAGLVREAREVADEAIEKLRGGGNQSDLAEGLVLLADITLLAGDPLASRAAAEEATQLFGLQQRAPWLSLAQAAIARAGLAQGDTHASLAALASDAAARLDAIGLVDRATMAHAVAGRLRLANGDLDTGLAELDRAGSRRRRGTVAGRLAAWEAEGEARAARGDRRGAMAALRCALAVVDDQQANLGATELRAHVAVYAGAAAQLGLRLALGTRRPSCIWQWTERHRANSLRTSPARPPRDEVLAAQLAELRGLAQDIASCATRGDDPRALLVRQADLERRARERAWQATGPKGSRGTPRPATLQDVSTALGGAALVEFAEVDGYLHAVVVANGRCHHRRLAVETGARRDLGHLRLALRRLAYGGTNAALAAGAEEQLARSAARLDNLLLAPIAGLIGPRPVVVVPTGELHATPWAVLPTLAGRAISVAPSARLWLQTATPDGARRDFRPPHAGRTTVIVAGPGLAGAEQEAVRLGALHPSGKVLTGTHAHVAAVIAALEGADLVHIAAHASFRADNGLWSSLELADGVLTVYELEQLRRPPQVVVLSACQSGLSALQPGNEMLGLVAALLTLGTRVVVAAVVPVEDLASEPLMVALHERLLAGDSPAVALATAQAVSAGAAGVSYVCFGGNV